jgi:cytochrome c553
MERRWLYVALVSLGCFELRPGHAESAEQAPDTMEARVMACAPCHGANGEGTNNAYFPRLAGKPAGYLTNQLLAFHTGRRHYPPMNYLLAYQSDDYLRKIADYFAAQRPPLPPPAVPEVSNEILARGESIVATATRRPACPPVRVATARI